MPIRQPTDTDHKTKIGNSHDRHHDTKNEYSDRADMPKTNNQLKQAPGEY